MPKSGVYETEYGNACAYVDGDNIAHDMDMLEDIPVEMVDFSKFIREF